MLPEGWKRVRLEQVAEVRTGIAKGRTAGPDAVALPYLRVANVQDGHLDLDKVKTIVVDRGLIERYSLKAGDVLMTEGGDFDKLGRGAVWQAPIEPCLHQNHVFAVRPDSDLVDSNYLSALSASEYGRAYFLSCAKRSTNLASINSTQLKAFPLLLPPTYEEQRRMGRMLCVWDAAIVATEQLLVNSRRQRNSLLSVLLCMPVSDAATQDRKSAFPPSVQPGIPTLPPTPAGWTLTELGKHLIEVRRPAPLTPSERYRLVTVKRSRGGVQLREELAGQYIKTPTQFYIREGDFLISKRQVVHGACGLVPAALDSAIVSNEYAVLNSDGQIDLRFLRYLSETRYFQQTCFHSSIGVHVEKMIFKTDRWLKWPFNIPPLAEQRRIVEVLDAAWSEMELVDRQISKLRQEKAALMADLLTGKRRMRLLAADLTP